MATPTKIRPGTALARLFRTAIRAGDAVSFSLPGGAALFMAGEPADQLFMLRTGRLAAIRREGGQETRFLGLIRAGEPAGEMSMITGAPHSADLIAVRDCEILALPRAAFFRAIETEPALMIELARLMIGRVREATETASLTGPSVFGFIGVAPGVEVRALVERVAGAVRRLGYSAAVAGVEARTAPTAWFSNIEHAHDFVFYAAEDDETGWKALLARQVDRLVRVAPGGAPPAPNLGSAGLGPLQAQRLVDLILVQPPDADAPIGSEAWAGALAPSRLFQVREAHGPDVERMARVIAGQAVSLVLSGGAARAYAHIGAVAALRERQVPIDFVAGVSTGAVIAAGVAMGWSDAELDRRIGKAFVETSPLDDIAFPLVAMTHGRKVRARLAEHFGDREIGDLWLPFFCVSSNLTTGVYELHRRGLLREALRASLALPGILPPVVKGADVLVDGAVINNFPADIMRSIQPGPIVGVDVGRGRSVDAQDLMDPASVWRWLLSGAWRRGPPIVSLLMRAATVTTGPSIAAAREATDVLVLPMVDDIEIRDWKAYAPAVAAGRQATLAALDKLAGPVTALRRRASIDDPAANATAGAAG